MQQGSDLLTAVSLIPIGDAAASASCGAAGAAAALLLRVEDCWPEA